MLDIEDTFLAEKNLTTVFDALCDLVIYHHCDLRRPKQVGRSKFNRSRRFLCEKRPKMLTGEADESRYCYDEFLEFYVPRVLGKGWQPAHDYWGARCFAWNGDSEVRPHCCAGDSCGFYMFFDDKTALDKYLLEFKRDNCE